MGVRTKRFSLVERDEELDAIQRVLECAVRGEGGAMLVEGAAGIGKSALLTAAAANARDLGLRCLEGRGAELEQDLGFAVARQLFDELPQHTEMAEVVHGLFRLTEKRAEQSPLLVAIDDAHWCDEPSLRFLGYLAARVGDRPIALILSVRTGEPSRDLVEQLRDIPGAMRLRPAPLTPDGARAVVQSALPAAASEFTEAAHRVTGGNPFLLGEVLRAAELDSLTPEDLERCAPDAVSRSVLAHLKRLGRGCERLARAIAIAGDGTPLHLTSRLAELSAADAASAADALAGAEIVTAADPAGFVHPLIRSAVYADIPDGERAFLHLSAARFLHTDAAQPPEVASHLLRAAAEASPWTIERLREAAVTFAEAGAPESAALMLERALAEPPCRETRGELLVELGEIEARLGRETSVTRLEQAIDLLDDPLRRAEAGGALGRSLMTSGRFAESAAALEAAKEVAPPDDLELADQLEAGYVSAAQLVAPLRDDARERLAALLSRGGSPGTPLERALWGARAFDLSMGVTARQEAIDLARASLGEGELARAPEGERMGIYAVCAALGYSGELAEADAALTDARATSERRGDVLGVARACVFRALARLRTGRVEDAAADARTAIDLAPTGSEAGGPAAHAHLAQALIEQGDIDGARAALDIGDESQFADQAPFAYWLAARARLRAHDGDHADAVDDLTACGTLLGALGATNPAVLSWRSAAATSLAALGETDRAEVLMDQELELAREFGEPRAIGVALRRGAALKPNGEGISMLEDAVQVLAGAKVPLDHGHALADLGAALRRAGRRADARMPLRLALDRGRSCQAHALAQRARDELLAAGGRPRRAELTGRAALTPSEQRVARLAVDGRSNPQIAEQLVISRKTVEYHLGNAYRKLEVTNRAGLATAFGGEPQAA